MPSIHLPSDPAIALLGFFSREMSAYIHQKNVYNSFIQKPQIENNPNAINRKIDT